MTEPTDIDDLMALILMLVERLERADKISGYPNNKKAIKAGRARLDNAEVSGGTSATNAKLEG